MIIFYMLVKKITNNSLHIPLPDLSTTFLYTCNIIIMRNVVRFLLNEQICWNTHSYMSDKMIRLVAAAVVNIVVMIGCQLLLLLLLLLVLLLCADRLATAFGVGLVNSTTLKIHTSVSVCVYARVNKQANKQTTKPASNWVKSPRETPQQQQQQQQCQTTFHQPWRV